jgi:hypothetical protein
MSASFDALIARVAATQHSLITWPQVVSCGGTRKHADHRVAVGRWTRLGRGLFRVNGSPFTWESRVLAACLASGGVASHRTAAVLWGLEGFRQGPPEITIERGHSFRRPDVRVHESSDLILASMKKIDRIPATGIDRLLVDLGAVVPVPTLEEAVFDAINRRLLTWPDLWEALSLHARRGRNGIGRLRQVIELNYGLDVPQSRLETILERLVVDAGFPRLDRQIEIFDDEGFVARCDSGYINRKIALEADGRSVHARRLALVADNEKRNRIRLAGWLLLVFTPEVILRRPSVVCGNVSQALLLHPPRFAVPA